VDESLEDIKTDEKKLEVQIKGEKENIDLL